MQRSKAIDILRAVAILLVLGRHMGIPRVWNDGSFLGYALDGITTRWLQGGWIGVDLFFVLSGFLVSGLLFREHQKLGCISAKHFLIRRGLRIYPAFWVFIAFTAVILYNYGALRKSGLITELLFLQNYGQPLLWSHTWSLAVEEHFYIFLLLLLLFLARTRSENPFQLIPSLFIVLAIFSLVLRIATELFIPYGYDTHHFPSHLRMDSLFCGVLISYYYHYDSVRFLGVIKRFHRPAFWLGILALTPAFVLELDSSSFLHTFGFTLFYLGSGLILCSVLQMDPGNSALVRTGAYIGSHSYSIYLWHLPVIDLAVPWFGKQLGTYTSWDFEFAFYVVVAIGIGIVMSVVIEFPVLRLRDRLYPSRARALSISLFSSLEQLPAELSLLRDRKRTDREPATTRPFRAVLRADSQLSVTCPQKREGGN